MASECNALAESLSVFVGAGPQFYHIPFQSGDNDVLREMKRGYTHQRYRRIIDTIRHYDPHAAVSGDAIAGFPGETEEQFQRTMDLVREVGFDVVNTAAYSPRPNTPAAHWENQVGAPNRKGAWVHYRGEVVGSPFDLDAERGGMELSV